MRVVKVVAGLVLTLMGVVWTLQGFGASYVPTSFMTKSPEWILIGIATAIGGTVLTVRTLRGS